MTERPPSAAASLYPHLKSVPAPGGFEQRRDRAGSVADAMYPRPKPPLKNPYLEGMTESEWHDTLMAMAGLRRRRR